MLKNTEGVGACSLHNKAGVPLVLWISRQTPEAGEVQYSISKSLYLLNGPL